MLEISFELNGRRIRPDEFGDALEGMVIKQIEERFRTLLGDVRDPQTGEPLRLTLQGSSLDDLEMKIEGTEAAVAEAERRLADDKDAE